MADNASQDSSKLAYTPLQGRGSTSGRLKFKHASSNLSNFAFARDQTWVSQSNANEIHFVNQSGDIKDRTEPRAQDRKQRKATTAREDPQVQSAQQKQHFDPSIKHETQSPSTSPDNIVVYHGNSWRLPLRNDYEKSKSWIPSRPEKTYSNEVPVLSPAAPLTLFEWPPHFSAAESACLMHVNLDLLSIWADGGHPARHFHRTVLHRARTFPPLLSAALTCAATHLLSTPAHRTPSGVVQYRGMLLHGICREAVIQCHNTSVANLLQFCDEGSIQHDDQVLVALTSLRYHEELLSLPDQGEDRGQLLRIFNAFYTARNLYIPHHPTSESQSATSYLAYFGSLRYSILRLALRQELTSAYQRRIPVHMDLSPWLPLAQIVDWDVDGAIWADRCLLHCVNVTNFCYKLDHRDPQDEWTSLLRMEALLESSQPNALAPLVWQCNEHKTFPLIWYTDMLPVNGVQWLALSKILLVIHSPSSLQTKSGTPVLEPHQLNEVRSIVRTICGIADSNPTIQPAYVHAQMAISIAGVYFSDPLEQDAILAILAHLEYEFGWPTASDIAKLKSVWDRSP